MKKKHKNKKEITAKNGHWLSRELSFLEARRIAEIFNLEILHRISWRSRGVWLSMILLWACQLWAAPCVFAQNKRITDQDVLAFLSKKKAEFTALISREKESQPLRKEADAAPSKRAEGRMVVDPATGERRYQLPTFVPLPKNVPKETYKLKGEVAAKIHTGMSVVFERDEAGASTELWVEFTDGIKLSRVKSVQDFEAGDIVELEIQEAQDKSRRVVTGIRMIREKTDSERAREAAADRAEEARAAMRSLEGQQS